MLYKIGGHPVIVSDRDHVVAVSGIPKKEMIERRVSASLEDIMEQRRGYIYTSKEQKRLQPVEGVERYASVAIPILSGGDLSGTVMFLASEPAAAVGDSESKLIQAAAAFLGKQMEE